MSHFTVLVIGPKVEEQLEPFWELDLMEDEAKTDPRAVFKDIEPEYRKRYETNKVERVVMPTGELLSTHDEAFAVMKDGFLKEHVIPENLERVFIPLNELYPTFDMYMTKHVGYEKIEEGKYGYYHNPNAKWDWFQIGGRWTGFFKLKEDKKGLSGEPGLMTSPNTDSSRADQALKGDIDFEAMKEEFTDKAILNWEKAKGLSPQEREWRFGIRAGQSKKDYIKDSSNFCTFAVLKDGIWYERGNMGWWGIVTDEKDDGEWEAQFTKLIEGLPDTTLLTVVDCHI